ncbi:hypothetical protein GCM10010124_04570 [Pilimelia terevasa]|uniref:Uncharacterized protein n=1 Tax=Pilimelia terevasa TaxID=53372 RepID=A0A8J3BJ82_9ACTN|nr:hypothetical protein [Pilimelia terevasa]GGK15028.1 hypothetical protein GCM10010124_04570 [Pilimelia terevasa]
MYALDALLERLPPALVDDPAGKRLRLVGDRLPDALSHRIGLEARLDDTPRVDLLLLAADARELAVLAGTDPAVAIDPQLAAARGWQAGARLARRAARLGAGPLPPGVWVELDTDSAAAPALFTAAAPDPGQPAAAGWDAAATVAEVLHEVADRPPPAALLERVAAVAASALAVRQVGVFGGRPHAGVRLFCATPAGPPPSGAAVAELLGALGWSGHAAALAHWADVAAAHADTVHLGLDVTADGPLPTVGLEIAMADAAQPHQDPRWVRLLDRLVADGLATAAKAAAVARLGRGYTVRLPHPRHFRQGLHHLKISVAPSGAAGAKAYFGAYETRGAA